MCTRRIDTFECFRPKKEQLTLDLDYAKKSATAFRYNYFAMRHVFWRIEADVIVFELLRS